MLFFLLYEYWMLTQQYPISSQSTAPRWSLLNWSSSVTFVWVKLSLNIRCIFWKHPSSSVDIPFTIVVTVQTDRYVTPQVDLDPTKSSLAYFLLVGLPTIFWCPVTYSRIGNLFCVLQRYRVQGSQCLLAVGLDFDPLLIIAGCEYHEYSL